MQELSSLLDFVNGASAGALGLLKAQAYVLLFVAVLVDQGGPSIPAQPVLVAMGCLIAAGSHSLGMALMLALAATLLADLVWLYVGNRFGSRLLQKIARRSKRMAKAFDLSEQWMRKGSCVALLGAKLAPVPNFVLPLVAGAQGRSWRCYIAEDGIASSVWNLAFLAGGFFMARPAQISPWVRMHFVWAALACVACGLAFAWFNGASRSTTKGVQGVLTLAIPGQECRP